MKGPIPASLRGRLRRARNRMTGAEDFQSSWQVHLFLTALALLSV